MLTRLEVDGFKNLLGLQVDLGPFTCIAGENGTGKSNVFDAIQFLSLLADNSLMEAAQEVHGVHGERSADPRDLFWNGHQPGSLSEGTLRFLALCVLLEDPTVVGVLCMEEPENGIHPANIEAMVSLVQDLAVDPQRTPGPDNPFRQVIVNTHSPAIVQLVGETDVLFAEITDRKAPDGTVASGLSLRPLGGTWRAGNSAEPPVTRLDILPYLTAPPHAQLTLEADRAVALLGGVASADL